MRVGFLGVGWIGRHRMRALCDTGLVTEALVADSDPALTSEAAAEVGGRAVDVDALLGAGLDGLVVATPSALHAAQSVAALQAGVAVFCQKPLGRDEAETRAVVAAAERADRLLGVDLSYRHLAATRALREALPGIGRVFAAELVFHNAYGPDKAWFRDPVLSGGGCVIDLGTHLVDLALHLLHGTGADVGVRAVSSRLVARGELLPADPDVVEDWASARVDLTGGTVLDLTCSWDLHAGQDAVIRVALQGTDGGLLLENVGGSFYDFRAVRHDGTTRTVLVEPPDDWGGRAVCDWGQRLAAGERFDPQAHELVTTAAVLDRVYGRASA